MKIRYLYRDRGDHVSFREASEHVIDARDLIAGRQPGWLLEHTPIAAEPGEVEFDHTPSEAELDAAFPARKKPDGAGSPL